MSTSTQTQTRFSKLDCVSKKRPAFTTCYNFYIHSSIATIFGTNIAEKVGNQNVLYSHHTELVLLHYLRKQENQKLHLFT